MIDTAHTAFIARFLPIEPTRYAHTAIDTTPASQLSVSAVFRTDSHLGAMG
jgi:hypothetical protein